jgi:hypothetical protein
LPIGEFRFETKFIPRDAFSRTTVKTLFGICKLEYSSIQFPFVELREPKGVELEMEVFDLPAQKNVRAKRADLVSPPSRAETQYPSCTFTVPGNDMTRYS